MCAITVFPSVDPAPHMPFRAFSACSCPYNVPRPSDTASPAQLKLREAFSRAGWKLRVQHGAEVGDSADEGHAEHDDEYEAPELALDIGASPGGWSKFLFEDAGCRCVVAVGLYVCACACV